MAAQSLIDATSPFPEKPATSKAQHKMKTEVKKSVNNPALLVMRFDTWCNNLPPPGHWSLSRKQRTISSNTISGRNWMQAPRTRYTRPAKYKKHRGKGFILLKRYKQARQVCHKQSFERATHTSINQNQHNHLHVHASAQLFATFNPPNKVETNMIKTSHSSK